MFVKVFKAVLSGYIFIFGYDSAYYPNMGVELCSCRSFSGRLGC